MRIARTPLLYAAGFTALWTVLAWINPTTTYHLAPLLVPLIPWGIARSEGAALPSAATVAATALAIGAGLVLAAADRLQGPSLLPVGGALTETLVFALLAGVSGLVLMRRLPSPELSMSGHSME